MNFFNKLPTINYNGNMAKNILARAKLSDATKANSRLFLPYTSSGEERVDTLSNQYYGSPGYSWLIWFANDTIDPYYGMALNEYDLEQLIISKYGSVADAQRKVAYYKNNWATDTSRISIQAFNALSSGAQKYWSPVLDYNLNVTQYVRKQDDQILNTNRVGTLNISSISGEFKVGEEIQDVMSSTTYAFCTYSDSSTITVQHIHGAFGDGGSVFGKESGAVAVISTANNYLATTSAYDQSYYWTEVSYYDYELEQNEKKKEILLMDAMHAPQADYELKKVMSTT